MNDRPSEFSPAGVRTLRGQVALIADAGNDVGTGIARHLAAAGAVVALCGRERETLERHAGEICARGERAIAAAMDGSGAEAVRDLIDRVRANLGRIDVLVNNPAETPGRALAESSHADLQAALESSLIASFAYLRAVIPSMRERRYGRVINICSLDYLGAATRIDLAAAHAGIFGLTRSVALDTAADGITVNCVVKGDVAGTDMPAADAEKLASRIPAKRLGKIDDLVHAIGFFASASTKYVTGQTLFVCGGKSAFFSMSV